jgi:hypothetical protein
MIEHPGQRQLLLELGEVDEGLLVSGPDFVLMGSQKWADEKPRHRVVIH